MTSDVCGLPPCEITSVMVHPTSWGSVAEELHVLAKGLRRCLRGREMSVLAVGSVGRAHMEAGSTGSMLPTDYDIVVIAHRLSEAERLMARRRIHRWLRTVSPSFSVPVSVGLLRSSDLPRRPFTLFNYEMRYGHQVLVGDDPTPSMPLYRVEQMPHIEATRLLLNRGVLLWGDRTRSKAPGGGEEASGTGLRNAKALLAIGDALLIVDGAYHWSYQGRLANAGRRAAFESFGEDLRARYITELKSRIAGISSVGRFGQSEETSALLSIHAAVLRFVEERRLGRSFSNWRDYAECDLQYPRYLTPSWIKRFAHLIGAFGPPRGSGFYRRHVGRAPEEVLLGAYPSCAYGSAGADWLKSALNWPPSDLPTPLAVWENFHRVWTRAR
jgi:hypothetical protein